MPKSKGDYSKLFLARVFLYALHHKKTENIFCRIKFLRFTQGSEKLQKHIISQKMKIIVLGRLIAQMKRFDALVTTQKTPALCEVPFLKKSRKTAKKWLFLKNGIFFAIFLYFFQNETSQRVGGFCVVISASFKLSNTLVRWFSFFGW